MSLTGNVDVSEVLGIIHLRKAVSSLHRNMLVCWKELQLKGVQMYRRIPSQMIAPCHLPLKTLA